jgi:hypothetical protein
MSYAAPARLAFMLPAAPVCGLGSCFLVELNDCRCFRSMRRLAERVDQEVFERQAALPARAMDPALLRELPF